MARFFKDRLKSKGLAPGTPVFIGDRKVENTLVNIIDYTKEDVAELKDARNEEIEKRKHSKEISWINLYGIHDQEKITEIGSIFNLSPMLLEDIVNTDQRPKFEEGEDYIALILKSINYDEKSRKIQAEQISLILGEGYVLTMQEQSIRIFEPVRDRIRNNKGRLRISGADYLAYALLDNIIDNYLFAIGNMGEQIEDLCKLIITRPRNTIASQVYNFKIEINYLRKIVRPVKEMLLHWLNSESMLVDKKTRVYLRHLTDLATQADESIEIYNNILTDTLNIYNTNITNKTNEIIKILTIFTTIFIPLTFLVGIYGMNFKYFPELEYRYSYPIFWGVSILITIISFLFFKKRKWL
jgi:magnesium transporter